MSNQPAKRSVLVPILTASMLLFAIATLGYASYIVFFQKEKPGAELSISRQKFSLVSHRGEVVSAETFVGKPSAFFFGYTHCPEVCPTTLMSMTDIIREMGNKADGARFVFVSLDPERDTQDVLAEYMTSFAPQIMGVTGDPAEIRKLAKGMKVFFRKVGEGEDYDLDHMAWIYLFDRKGDFVRTVSLQNPNENMADALVALMR